MDDEYYVGLYDYDVQINLTNDFIFSDDFIAIYLARKIEKNKFEIIKTIHCMNLKPYSPRDIIYFDDELQDYLIVFPDKKKYLLDYNIFIKKSSTTGIYNRNVNLKIKDLLYSMVNLDNEYYNNIRDAILYFTENNFN